MVAGSERGRATLVRRDYVTRTVDVIGDVGAEAFQQGIRHSGEERDSSRRERLEEHVARDGHYLPEGIRSRTPAIGMQCSSASWARSCWRIDCAVLIIAGYALRNRWFAYMTRLTPASASWVSVAIA